MVVHGAYGRCNNVFITAAFTVIQKTRPVVQQTHLRTAPHRMLLRAPHPTADAGGYQPDAIGAGSFASILSMSQPFSAGAVFETNLVQVLPECVRRHGVRIDIGHDYIGHTYTGTT